MIPRTPTRIRLALRELTEDMDAPVEWHYAEVAESFRDRLNGVLHALRELLGSDEIPDDFDFADREYSATGKTVGEIPFDRLRRAVLVASELAEKLSAQDALPEIAASLAGLHPEVQRVSASLMTSGHPSQAILEAFKAVNIRVKRMSGLDDDGKSLMGKALSERAPVLRINRGTNRSDLDEQEGFKLIFMGAMQGIRNPKAHELMDELEPSRAFEYLALASLLMRRLDDAEGSGGEPG